MGETKQAEKFANELARNKQGECVRVVVRVRPLNTKEKQDGMEAVAIVGEANASVSLRNPEAPKSEMPKVFTFDQTYGPNAQQKSIYDKTAAKIVESVCEGYNGTIFAYGQTGAGKTHTMEGCPDPPELKGIIPNSFKHIFEKISLEGSDKKKYLVRASYLEIYNEEIRDLLSRDPKNRLELRESVDNGVYVKDQTVTIVKSVAEIDRVMADGKKYRSVGSTLMNQTSSRSHSIFTIIVETSELDPSGEEKIRVGKLNLVDLAGSERQSKTGATGDRLKEATKINLSLSALGNVISALVESKSSHVPYRDSKLTRLLQDSLGGNTKTVMIANCGPADYNYDETLSTLRYANRAKNIKNKPKINEDPKDAMLRQFQEEIMRLKEELAAREGGNGGRGRNDSFGSASQIINDNRDLLGDEQVRELQEKAQKEKQDLQRKLEEKMAKLEAEKKLSEKEREDLIAKLKKENERALNAKQAKDALQQQLKSWEEKMIIGGLMMDKAAKQEAELRRKEVELEEQRMKERILARKVLENEEELLIKEDQYSSLRDEVDEKTKKIRKLWNKYQATKTEIKDLHQDFQREREDMLFTIRELTRQLKLKQLIIENFIPADETEKLSQRARWDERNDQWIISRLEFAGNNVCPSRPITSTNRRYPETDMARRRKSFDTNPRYKAENVYGFELEKSESVTKNYEPTAHDQSVNAAIKFVLGNDDEDDVKIESGPENLPNPYLSYNIEEKESSGRRGSTGSRPGTSSRKSKSSRSSKRPGTASRSGRSNSSRTIRSSSFSSTIDNDQVSRSVRGEFLDDEEKDPSEVYPSARGLVSRDY